MPTSFDLKGRVAIVTGGNGGIGLGMARGLAGAGASIVVAARDKAKSQSAVKELAGLGAKAMAVDVEVQHKKSVDAMVKATLDAYGRIDILVANAGINIRKRPEEYLEADWEKVVAINLSGAFLCAQAVYPAMKTQGGGKIITTGSMTSIFGVPFAPAYCATKGGIMQLSRSLATAWAKDNIQVNCVLPGWIDTDLTRGARKQVPELHANVERRTPAGRWGAPDDFAGIAVFLSSPASDFVTGTAIPVDGGYSILGG